MRRTPTSAPRRQPTAAASRSSSFPDEVLNGEEFESLLEARVVISNWVVEYNTVRPHRGLGMMTPSAFAAGCNEGPK
jgi:putative transposase